MNLVIKLLGGAAAAAAAGYAAGREAGYRAGVEDGKLERAKALLDEAREKGRVRRHAPGSVGAKLLAEGWDLPDPAEVLMTSSARDVTHLVEEDDE